MRDPAEEISRTFGERLKRLERTSRPAIEVLVPARRRLRRGGRLGVFPASFNPPTRAHREIVARAQADFQLEEVLLLLGLTNADKTAYEASLEDRLAMVRLACEDDPTLSVGAASHPFFVDLLEPLGELYDQPQIFFIMGADTLLRVLDKEGRYYRRYHKPYADRWEALGDLFAQGQVLVAARPPFTRADLDRWLEGPEAAFRSRISWLDLPDEVKGISASLVRERLGRGQPITSLVPPAVERYLTEHALYRSGPLAG